VAGGTVKTIGLVESTTDWFHIAVTWDTAADEVKAYFQGSQTGSTLTGLGNWLGSLSENETNVGALMEVPSYCWKGWLAHPAAWTKALTPAQIASLAEV
jgi:hypothetical protein